MDAYALNFNGDRQIPVFGLGLLKGLFSPRFAKAPLSFKLVILVPTLAAIAFVIISWTYGPVVMIPFMLAMKFVGLGNEFQNFWVTNNFGYNNIQLVAKYIASPLFLFAGWLWFYYSFRKLLHIESFRDEDHYNSFNNIVSSLTTGGMSLPLGTFTLVLAGLVMVGTIGFKFNANPSKRAIHPSIDKGIYTELDMKKGAKLIKDEFDYVLEGVRNTAEVMKLGVAFSLETGLLPFVAFILLLYSLSEFVDYLAKEWDVYATVKGKEALESLTTGTGEGKRIKFRGIRQATNYIADVVELQNEENDTLRGALLDFHKKTKESGEVLDHALNSPHVDEDIQPEDIDHKS